jgi:ATP-dependent Lhr-like helicase
MGYVTDGEARASGWDAWLRELRADGRVVLEPVERAVGAEAAGAAAAGAATPVAGGRARWLAAEAPRDPKTILRGRLEALGPVEVPAGGADEPLLLELEREGAVLRCRLEGRLAWCDRRLLARIHRYTLERLRREIEPVSAATFWRFLACWQHVDDAYRLEGPRGVAEVVGQLAGFEIPAAAWEAAVLPARVRGYRPEWIDQITLTGEIVWGRLWGAGGSPIRTTPVCLLPRDDLHVWLSLAEPRAAQADGDLPSHARAVLDVLRARGALFTQELERLTALLATHLNMGLAALIAQGLLTCDSWSGLRRLIKPSSERRRFGQRAPLVPAGRWSLLRPDAATASRGVPATAATPVSRGTPATPAAPGGAPAASAAPAALGVTGMRAAPPAAPAEAAADFVVRRLLARYGVVLRRLLEREKVPVPWRDLVRVCRHLELRGEVRGGRFVAGFAGEQYALPEAVDLLRQVRRRGAGDPVSVSASDPLNLQGILTPAERVPTQARRRVQVG